MRTELDMKHTPIVLIGFFILGNAINTQGQNLLPANDTLSISLTQVWQKAEEHSRAIEIKRKEVGISKEEIKDAQTERYPELDLTGSAEKATNIPVYEHGLFSAPTQHEVIHNLYRVGSSAYLNIYNGNKLNLKIKEDKVLYQISVIKKDQIISDIRYKAASLYLELQKSFIFRALITQDIADQEKQLVEIKSFHKNGVILKSDVLRVELDLSKRKLMLVQIENDILIINQKLNIIIGEPDERVIKPVELPDYSLNEVESYDACLTNALQHSFPYHISEQQTELSKLHYKQIRANTRPKIGLAGDFYYMNPQIFLYPYNPFWYSLGIGGFRASYPLSSLYHNIHKQAAAKLEIEKEEEAHKDTEDKVRQQVKESYLRYKEALVQVEVAKVNVDQAIENERIIKDTYFNQTSLITDLLDADVQVLQTKFELASAKILAQTKYYLLQNVIGVL